MNVTLEEANLYFSKLSTQLIKEKASKAWFQNTGYHSAPTYLSTLHNGQLKKMAPEMSIKTYSEPLNIRSNELNVQALTNLSMQAILVIGVIFAMSLVPSSFVTFLIEEKQTGSKHLQQLSGVPPWLYWAANFIWDMGNYLVTTILVLCLFLIFWEDAFVKGRNVVALSLLLIWYGFSITPMMYPFSFLFTTSSTAFVMLTCFTCF